MKKNVQNYNIIFYLKKKDEDPGSKNKPTDDLLEKIDNIDAQINTCLDGLLEKGSLSNNIN